MSFDESFCDGAMVALVASAFFVFIINMLKAETQPPRAAWLAWTLVDGVTGASMLAKGVMNAQLATVVLGAVITTLILCFMKAKGPLVRMDKIGLGAAVVGMGLWLITSEPMVALAISLGVTMIGGVLAGKASWKSPKGDDRVARTLWACASSLVLMSTLANRERTFAQLAEPAAFTVMDVGLAIIIWCRWPLRQQA